jgi:monomeric sarcosine oxidase
LLETDICIVGGGIMGTATAYALSQMSDKKILLIDRYGIGNDRCSSNDINRVFRYSYGNDQYYTKMAVESEILWKQLMKETGQQLLIPTGLLMLEGQDNNANRFCKSSHDTLKKLKLGAREYNGPELAERFPQFHAERGFFDPHGAVLLASKSLEEFASQARLHGVTTINKQIASLPTKFKPEILTREGETIRAKKTVVTIGPWTNDLLHIGLPAMTPTRQQVLYLRPKQYPERFKPEVCPIFFTDYHYGLPSAGIEGVKVSNKQLNDPVNPETAKRTVDPDQIEQCRAACRKFVPDLADGGLVHSKVCLYDMTQNSDFVIDADPENHDIVYGYGFSGHGFKFAPLIGKLLAELVLDREPSVDLSRFSVRQSERRAQLASGQLGKGE